MKNTLYCAKLVFVQLGLVKPVRQMLVCFPVGTEVKIFGMGSVQRGTSRIIGLNNIFIIAMGNRKSIDSFKMNLAIRVACSDVD